MAIARKAGQPSESLRQACATVVEPLRARSEEVAQAIYTRIHEAVPDAMSGEDPDYRQGVKRAIEALLQYTFDGLTQDPGGPRAAPPAAALEQARRAARAGVGVGTVLRRYLAGHEHLGELIADAAQSSRQAGRELVLRQVRATQAELVGELTEAIEREYHRERERIAPSPQRRRVETTRRLLAGEPTDPTEIAELGYEINGRWHVGAVLTGEHGENTLRQLKQRLGTRLLWVAVTQATAWAWLGAERTPTTEHLEQLAYADGATHRSVAIGEPAKGLDGWRLTHHQAREAVAIAAHTPSQVARYGDAPLLAAALNNATLAQSLTALLARLDRDGDGAKLRRTLCAYIDLGCNASSTAARLSLGRHTVEKHALTAEDLLGRTLTSCLPELHTALHLHALEHGQ